MNVAMIRFWDQCGWRRLAYNDTFHTRSCTKYLNKSQNGCWYTQAARRPSVDCAGAVAGTAGAAIGAAAGCIASLGIACVAAVAGGVAGIAGGVAGAADAYPGCFPGELELHNIS